MAISSTRTRFLWAARILLALVFGAAGAAKLSGVPMMVEVFTQIGVGQWFRYVTGGVELTGVALLLTPATGLIGALLLTATMIGAVVTHLFVIGGSPVPAFVLGALSGLVVVQLWSTQGASLRSGLGSRSPEA